jgi:hypothetical protein
VTVSLSFKGNVFPIDVNADDFITGLDQNTNTEGTSTYSYFNKTAHSAVPFWVPSLHMLKNAETNDQELINTLGGRM